MRFIFSVLLILSALSLFGYNSEDLFTVVKTGTKSQVEMILKDGVSIEARDSAMNTPLIAAAEEGKDEIVSYLLEKGADIEAKNNLEQNALMAASAKGQLKVVKVLLKKNINNINATDKNGNTALIFASGSKNINTVKLLVEKGADINAVNNKGENALVIAALNNNKETASYLYSKGAKIPEQFESEFKWIKDENSVISEGGTLSYLFDFVKTTSFYHVSYGNLLMIFTGIFFIFLAIKFGFEPLLLIPIGFGMIIGNIPVAFGDVISLYEKGSVLNYLYFGVKEGIYPPLIFLGIGA
ncbi:MAG: ankyrin repeat domain-containing protein, partial [Candidatus Pacearchaeota archaeon]